MQKVLLSEIKDNIKTGDLAAFNQRKFNSFVSWCLWLYHKVWGAKFTHVATFAWIGDHLFLVEAVPPKVTLTPIEMIEEFYWVPVNMKGDDKDKIRFLKRYLGTDYSILELIKTFFSIKPDKHALYCSELASRFYYEFGYITDRDAGQTPDTMVMAALTRGALDEPIHVAVDRGNYK